MKVTIHVKPGSSRPRVGGAYGDALVVAVRERAVEGKATEAALEALATTLGCRRRAIRLIAGATSRTKIVDVPDQCRASVARLVDSAEPADPSGPARMPY